jgi:hypothetical protein
LDFCDVGVVFERIGRGRRAQGVRTKAIDLNASACGILASI